MWEYFSIEKNKILFFNKPNNNQNHLIILLEMLINISKDLKYNE